MPAIALSEYLSQAGPAPTEVIAYVSFRLNAPPGRPCRTIFQHDTRN